jgi:hypothetical protein
VSEVAAQRKRFQPRAAGQGRIALKFVTAVRLVLIALRSWLPSDRQLVIVASGVIAFDKVRHEDVTPSDQSDRLEHSPVTMNRL